MMRVLFLACLAALPAAADVTTPSGRIIDCYCTDSSGARVELGQSICLQVDGRMFTATCEMALNVPIWRETGEGCLGASLSGSRAQPLPQSVKPALDPGAIDPEI